MYKIYRPSPLIRAYNLEKALQTPAKYIISLKVITLLAVINLILQSPRHITQKSKV